MRTSRAGFREAGPGAVAACPDSTPSLSEKDIPFSMLRTLFFLLVIGLGTGCYTTHFYSDLDGLRPEADGATSHASTVFALVELGEAAPLRTLCPGGVSKITMQQTFVDGLLHYMTAGFYSPQTTAVWCKRRTR